MAPPDGRRSFLRVAVLGVAAGLAARVPRARAAGTTDALLLSCMDYRLMDDVARYMAGRQLRARYDHIVLAGGSLGALTDRYPAWGQTFWDHLQIAIQLHQIPAVILLDHRDCGAYKVILGPEHAKDPATERETHATQLRRLKGQITTRHAGLRVEMLLMSLDGSVEVIG